jgi:hypothetical protein
MPLMKIVPKSNETNIKCSKQTSIQMKQFKFLEENFRFNQTIAKFMNLNETIPKSTLNVENIF